MGDSWHTENIQIIYINLVVFITLMFGFYISKWKNLLDYISTCDSLLKHNKNLPLLKQIMMSDGTCILYDNVECKRLWGKWNEPPSKASLHPKKVMLQIWWDWKGILYYELLLENQTINS